MNILITNDDGIKSSAMQQLAARLRKEHDVWIVAPAEQKSASSHAITLKGAIKFQQCGEREYACYGTPADCVMISLKGFIKEPMDYIISGINYGPNIGTDIIFSGTVGAARQGALLGVPSLAASLYAYEKPYYFDYPIEYIAHNIEKFKELWTPDHFLNINFPNINAALLKSAVTVPSRREYNDQLVTMDGPDGNHYVFWKNDKLPEAHTLMDSDYEAVEEGIIALSPIALHPLNITQWGKYTGLCGAAGV